MTKAKMTPNEKSVFTFLKKHPNRWFTAFILWRGIGLHRFANEREVRKLIANLRLVHNKKIASSHLGYCYTTRKEPLKKTASFIRRHALIELQTANAIDKQSDHAELAKQLELALIQDEPPKEAWKMAEQLWRLDADLAYAEKILVATYNLKYKQAAGLMRLAMKEGENA